jgi:hypothetical protein
VDVGLVGALGGVAVATQPHTALADCRTWIAVAMPQPLMTQFCALDARASLLVHRQAKSSLPHPMAEPAEIRQGFPHVGILSATEEH